MGSVIGIPTTRVSDLFVRQRLLSQVQRDQLDMFSLQMQLSTGHRFQVPSEDADAAQRVIGLQRLLERKEQVQTNLTTNQSYLSATDTALSTISDSMAEVRAVALGVLGTIASDTQREAAAQQVRETMRQLVDAGNQQFRGRYLFTGTNTMIQPFGATESGAVEYSGNEGRLSSYSDIDLLFDTNLHGVEVFGALSDAVLGTVNLDPALTFDTRLCDLNGGQGIASGSIAVSNGTHTSTIDLTSAETIGDVAAIIHAHPPAGTTLDVQVTATGLVIQLNGAPGDLLTIKEVGGGTTAHDLGILTTTGVGAPVVGEDLDPILRGTTRLNSVLGTRATALVPSAGNDNDLIFEAPEVGTSFDGIEIDFLDDGSVVAAGNEVATYDDATRTLTVTVLTGKTQARHVVAAVQTAFDAGTVPITARLNPLDDRYGGIGPIEVPAPGVPAGTTGGGSGTRFDQDMGLQIVNGNRTHVIDFANAETIEDVLNALNMSDAGVLAQINENATGIDIRSRLSGADFMIGENGGATATQLGLRTFAASSRLEDFNYGDPDTGVGGIAAQPGTDFTIGAADGTTLEIDVSTAVTVQDVLDTINNAVDPNTGLTQTVVTAQLAAFGNGIELLDTSGAVGPLTVHREPPSLAAIRLGLVPEGQEDNSAAAPPQAATATIVSAAVRSNLVFTANHPGTEYNGVRVVFEDGGSPGVNFDQDAGTLTFGITAGVTTAADIIDTLNGSWASAHFSATLDPTDATNDGNGNVADAGPLPFAGGAPGTSAAAAVAFPGTDNDVILTAATGGDGTPWNGTNVVFSGVPGGPIGFASVPGTLTITYDSAGTTAQQVVANLMADVGFTANFTISLDPADPAPNDGSGPVDPTDGYAAPMAGGTETLVGADTNPLEVKGLFTALLRLEVALQTDDPLEAQRAIALLDEHTLNMNFARAELGARQQGLDIMQQRLETEEIDLKTAVSEDFDADLVQAISDFTGRQVAFEAALRATAEIFQMTLLNFL
ncbi:MAG: hypothetical protein JXB62_16430 [Pirellulales bacterium]|nr:hypothetical protein [Pirellulales bacterium]